MATLTEYKRDNFPKRYVRKDARCRIYRQLYGISGELKGRRSNEPALDETRRFNSFWSYQQALAIYNEDVDAAKFTAAQRAEFKRRLDQLKQFKPAGVIGD